MLYLRTLWMHFAHFLQTVAAVRQRCKMKHTQAQLSRKVRVAMVQGSIL